MICQVISADECTIVGQLIEKGNGELSLVFSLIGRAP